MLNSIPETAAGKYYTTVVLGMTARSPHFTALEVGTLVTAEGDDDTEFLFPGSEDDFDVLDEEYNPLDREQGKYVDV